MIFFDHHMHHMFYQFVQDLHEFVATGEDNNLISQLAKTQIVFGAQLNQILQC